MGKSHGSTRRGPTRPPISPLAKKKASSKRVTSSFATPVASKQSLDTVVQPKQHAVFLQYLVALIGVSVLVLFGGGQSPLALGSAVVLSGLLLLFSPPKVGLSRTFRLGMVGFCFTILVGFLPQFYWPDAQWRVDAVETYGVDLTALLSIQPGVTFEGLILVIAGWSWLLVLTGYRVNHVGWKWLYFSISAVVGLFALVVILGNGKDWRDAGAGTVSSADFFPDEAQAATLLALGGIVGFCFAMHGLRGRRPEHLIGFVTAALCFFALLGGSVGMSLLLFVVFSLGWLLVSLAKLRFFLSVKYAVPLVLVIASVFLVKRDQVFEQLRGLLKIPDGIREELSFPLLGDALRMVRDAPLTGVGMGNFAAIFPQYRSGSDSIESVLHPKSDVLWVLTELGLFGGVSLLLVVVAFFMMCRKSVRGPNGTYRLIALLAVVAFLMHAFIGVSGHRPGALYFALFFAALAIPGDSLRATRLPRYFWRMLGGFLVSVGLLWMGSSAVGLRLHSLAKSGAAVDRVEQSIASKDFLRARSLVDASISSQPLRWELYHQRALIELEDLGDRDAAFADFQRARFAEPTLGEVSLLEGFAWLDHDRARAVEAWSDSFDRVNADETSNFARMIGEVANDPLLMDRLAALSLRHPRFRVQFLTGLVDGRLLKEVGADFAADPSLSQFNEDERTELLRHWLKYADAADVEVFLQKYGGLLRDEWLLWADFHKSQARFFEAVNVVRDSLPAPKIPAVEIDERELARLKRGFAVLPSDVAKGTALLRVYLDLEDYENAMLVAQAMIEFPDPPVYAFFWKAEALYHLGDYIESWYSFEDYLNL